MKSLERIKKIEKVLYILSKIAFIFSIIGCVGCVIGVISVGIWGKNVEIHNYLISIGVDYNFDKAICVCLCGVIECGFMIALYSFVKNFYKKSMELYDPFNKTLAKDMKKMGILHIVLPLLASIIIATIIACFGIDNFNMSNLSSITLGIVYLIVACILDYGAEPKKKN